MNWGWRITLVYIGFVAMILTLVLKARSEKVELVAPDYYAQEIVYQKRIDAIKRVGSLTDQVNVSIDSGRITLSMPPECSGKITRGTFHLYRPSDSSLDQSFPLKPDQSGAQWIETTGVHPGYYLVQVDWEMNGESYYYEESLIVP
jgi:nitrogen fixation protein FixH